VRREKLSRTRVENPLPVHRPHGALISDHAGEEGTSTMPTSGLTIGGRRRGNKVADTAGHRCRRSPRGGRGRAPVCTAYDDAAWPHRFSRRRTPAMPRVGARHRRPRGGARRARRRRDDPSSGLGVYQPARRAGCTRRAREAAASARSSGMDGRHVARPSLCRARRRIGEDQAPQADDAAQQGVGRLCRGDVRPPRADPASSSRRGSRQGGADRARRRPLT